MDKMAYSSDHGFARAPNLLVVCALGNPEHQLLHNTSRKRETQPAIIILKLGTKSQFFLIKVKRGDRICTDAACSMVLGTNLVTILVSLYVTVTHTHTEEFSQ